MKLDTKNLALMGFVIVAAVVDNLAGTNFLPMAIQALIGG